jgi:hypothetical protein
MLHPILTGKWYFFAPLCTKAISSEIIFPKIIPMNFLELEKIHFNYFDDFENISYFKSYRCFKKRNPKNMSFFKLGNYDEAKEHLNFFILNLFQI